MKYLVLLVMLCISTAFAANGGWSMGSLWTCKSIESTKYTCTKDVNGKRSVVKAKIAPARVNSLDVTFKMLSTPMKDLTIKETKRVISDGREWIESIQQLKSLPVPTMTLFTVKDGTGFQFIVISDDSEFEMIKREIQNAVAKSN